MINVTDQTVLGKFVKFGQATGIAVDSTGIKTFTISFTSASGYITGGANYANALDYVMLTLSDLSATDAVLGGVWVSGMSSSGFTINVKVTTASATVGATVKCNWSALGY